MNGELDLANQTRNSDAAALASDRHEPTVLAMPPHHDATLDWMIADVTERCRSVVDALTNAPVGPVQLTGVTMTLRAVVADLMTVVDQLDLECHAARAPTDTRSQPQAFELAFDAALTDQRDR